jgi:CBS domain-containing protein
MAKLVRDLMHRNVETCRPDATLGQVAVLLTKHHVHGLVVAEKEGEPLGVITDFDLLAGEWLSAEPGGLEVMRRMTAGELMSSPAGTIEASAPITEAAKRMRQEVIRRLVVTENGRMVGLLSVSDFVADLARRIPAERSTVADVMSDAFLVCRENTPIKSAARGMAETGWRSVVVLSPRGTALGVFSGLDLLAACEQENCGDLLVSKLMHPALTIPMGASLREAADMMIENHHHRLVVIDGDQPDAVPLGMISSFDIVAEMARPGSVWQL